MLRIKFFTAAILLLLSVFAWQAVHAAETKAATSKSAASAMPPVFVEITKAVAAPHELKINATGSMVAIDGIDLRPEISGRVTEIHFTSGQMVKTGDLLVQLNPDILAATLAQNEATLKNDEQTYRRYEELYKSRTISKSDLDKVVATLDADRARVKEAKARLQQAGIVAPFDGKIGLKQISIGDYVSAGQTLASLQAIDPIDVEFSVPEVYLNALAANQKVIVKPSAGQELFSGAIYAIDAAVNPATRSISARARIPNPDGKLIPGSFVEVTVYLGEQPNVITIPQIAVCYEGDKNFVYKVEDNKAVKANVMLGDRDKDRVVVTSGLKADDLIVTAGLIKLYEGANVVVTSDAAKAK